MDLALESSNRPDSVNVERFCLQPTMFLNNLSIDSIAFGTTATVAVTRKRFNTAATEFGVDNVTGEPATSHPYQEFFNKVQHFS